MHQPEPERAPEDEDSAIERRFAELVRRFWHRPKPIEPGDQ